MNKQSICLAMIVKDEAHVIERCLNSVLPVVDCVVIQDTGSTDDTMGIMYRIRDQYKHLDFQIKRRRWENFEVNRNALLADVFKTGAGYVLTIDADEELVTNGAQVPKLTHDLYYIRVNYAGTSYRRAALFLNDDTFYYKGVVHEYLERKSPIINSTNAEWDWHIRVYHEGARSKNPNTYLNDVKLLLEALASDPNTDSHDYARNVYYLAQSYRDAGKTEKAYDAYSKRAKMMNGWYEERWHAQFQAAKMLDKLKKDSGCEPMWEYMLAYQMAPNRAEPLYYCAKMLDSHYVVKEMILRQALTIAEPTSGLFVEPEIYKFYIPLELSVTLWYTNKRKEGLNIAQKLLEIKHMPESITQLITNNLTHY